MTDAEKMIRILHINQSLRNCYETRPMDINDCTRLIFSYFSGYGFINVVEDENRMVSILLHKFMGNNLIDIHRHTHPDYIGKGIGSEVSRLDAEACKGLTIVGFTPENNPLALKALENGGYNILGIIPSSWETEKDTIGRYVSYRVCD
jgi:GNAT superfamily N-acetyltransferase